MDINLSDVIQPELLVLIPVCWGIGILIRATKCPNKFIPFVNAIISVVLACLYVFASSVENIPMNVFIGLTQGIVCWAIAWVSYDKFIKNGVEKDYEVKFTTTNADGTTDTYSCTLDNKTEDNSDEALG